MRREGPRTARRLLRCLWVALATAAGLLVASAAYSAGLRSGRLQAAPGVNAIVADGVPVVPTAARRFGAVLRATESPAVVTPAPPPSNPLEVPADTRSHATLTPAPLELGTRIAVDDAVTDVLATFLLVRLAFPVHAYSDCVAALRWAAPTLIREGSTGDAAASSTEISWRVDGPAAVLRSLCERELWSGTLTRTTAAISDIPAASTDPLLTPSVLYPGAAAAVPSPIREAWLRSSSRAGSSGSGPRALDWHDLIPFSSSNEASASFASHDASGHTVDAKSTGERAERAPTLVAGQPKAKADYSGGGGGAGKAEPSAAAAVAEAASLRKELQKLKRAEDKQALLDVLLPGSVSAAAAPPSTAHMHLVGLLQSARQKLAPAPKALGERTTSLHAAADADPVSTAPQAVDDDLSAATATGDGNAGLDQQLHDVATVAAAASAIVDALAAAVMRDLQVDVDFDAALPSVIDVVENELSASSATASASVSGLTVHAGSTASDAAQQAVTAIEGQLADALPASLSDAEVAAHTLHDGDWGPLGPLSACGRIADPCMVHSTMRACVEDELCGWCMEPVTGYTYDSNDKQQAGAGADDASAAGGSPGITGRAAPSRQPGLCMSRIGGPGAGYWRETAAGTRLRSCALPLLVHALSIPRRFVQWQQRSMQAGDEGKQRNITALRLSPTPKTSLALRNQPPPLSSLGHTTIGAPTGGMAARARAFHLEAVPAERCAVIVTRSRPLIIDIGGDAAKMAFHFLTQTAPSWYDGAAFGSVKPRVDEDDGGGDVGADADELDTDTDGSTGSDFTLARAEAAVSRHLTINALSTLRQHVWVSSGTALTSSAGAGSWAAAASAAAAAAAYAPDVRRLSEFAAWAHLFSNSCPRALGPRPGTAAYGLPETVSRQKRAVAQWPLKAAHATSSSQQHKGERAFAVCYASGSGLSPAWSQETSAHAEAPSFASQYQYDQEAQQQTRLSPSSLLTGLPDPELAWWDPVAQAEVLDEALDSDSWVSDHDDDSEPELAADASDAVSGEPAASAPPQEQAGGADSASAEGQDAAALEATAAPASRFASESAERVAAAPQHGQHAGSARRPASGSGSVPELVMVRNAAAAALKKQQQQDAATRVHDAVGGKAVDRQSRPHSGEAATSQTVAELAPDSNSRAAAAAAASAHPAPNAPPGTTARLVGNHMLLQQPKPSRGAAPGFGGKPDHRMPQMRQPNARPPTKASPPGSPSADAAAVVAQSKMRRVNAPLGSPSPSATGTAAAKAVMKSDADDAEDAAAQLRAAVAAARQRGWGAQGRASGRGAAADGRMAVPTYLAARSALPWKRDAAPAAAVEGKVAAPPRGQKHEPAASELEPEDGVVGLASDNFEAEGYEAEDELPHRTWSRRRESGSAVAPAAQMRHPERQPFQQAAEEPLPPARPVIRRLGRPRSLLQADDIDVDGRDDAEIMATFGKESETQRRAGAAQAPMHFPAAVQAVDEGAEEANDSEEASVQSNNRCCEAQALPAIPSLEPAAVSVWHGSRLGLRGIAAIASLLRQHAHALQGELRAAMSGLLPEHTLDGATNPTGAVRSWRRLLASAAAASGRSEGQAAEESSELLHPRRIANAATQVLPALQAAAGRLLHTFTRGAAAQPSGVTGSVAIGGLEQFAVHVLGLWGVAPPRPTLTVISRRNKRFLINEAALASNVMGNGLKEWASRGGVDVTFAALEELPLFAQLRQLRRTSVLAGLHGSGLINSVFMRPGTALLQLLPPGVIGGDFFFKNPAKDARVRYGELPGEAFGVKQPLGSYVTMAEAVKAQELQMRDGRWLRGRGLPAGAHKPKPKHESAESAATSGASGGASRQSARGSAGGSNLASRHHWHHLDRARLDRITADEGSTDDTDAGSQAQQELGRDPARAALLRKASDCCGQPLFFSFWIQQDTAADVGTAAAAVRAAFRKDWQGRRATRNEEDAQPHAHRV